jgi:CO dehydrogenase maturation factor
VIGNKVDDESDVEFLREHVGDDLLGWIGRSGYVKSAERGAPQPIGALEPANRRTLELMRDTVDGCVKDWNTYTRQAVEFHLRNAKAWASERVGEDLAGQVDPEFVLDPRSVDIAIRNV